MSDNEPPATVIGGY